MASFESQETASTSESLASSENRAILPTKPISEEVQVQILSLRSMLSPEMNSDFTDADCERFLIARKFDMKKSLKMITEYHAWYNAPFTYLNVTKNEMRPKDLIQPADPHQEHVNRLCPHAFRGVDREGSPIYWEKSGFGNFSFFLMKILIINLLFFF
jgi:hypothetical protein